MNQSAIQKGEVRVLGSAIDDDFRVLGGRIFWLVVEGYNLDQMIKTAYKNMERIYIPGDRGENLLHFRTDIVAKELRGRF